MQRILLRNSENQLFRICAFGFYKDSQGEDYIKFSFPDLKSAPAKNGANDLIMEFSTHFHSGISHFKTSEQKRVHRNESGSKFADSELIHLMTYMIYDLNHFKVFTKKTSPNDYQIENIFNPKKGKVFEFYLSKISEEITIPTKNYEDLTWRLYHPFVNSNYRMLMVEYDYNDLDPSKNGVTLFRKYDQKENFIKVNPPKLLVSGKITTNSAASFSSER